MDRNIQKVLRYFAQFEYKPTLDELFLFYPAKIHKSKLINHINRTKKYTLGGYSNKAQISKSKIQKVIHFIRLIARFQQILLIGLSGSVAMNNANHDADIDLFIISSPHRVWTARFLANLAAILLGLKRNRKNHNVFGVKDKICLNMYFDACDMHIPKKKQTEYVAHEVLQMKPLVNKNRTYEQFLKKNTWVEKFFPNYSISNVQMTNKNQIQNTKSSNHPYVRTNWSLKIGDVIEVVLEYMQLLLINRHRTTEMITNSQLWFHPDDFEKKIVV